MAGILNRLADLTASFIVSRSHFGKVAGKPDFGLSEGIQLYFILKLTTRCEELHVEPTYVARLKNEGEDEMRGEKEAAETDHLTPARDENL